MLWAAIKATQARYPKAICAVYTGDHDVDKTTMLEQVEVGGGSSASSNVNGLANNSQESIRHSFARPNRCLPLPDHPPLGPSQHLATLYTARSINWFTGSRV